MDLTKNNGALIAAGEKLRNEREDRLREISDLKNAKAELWDAISKIATKLQVGSWTHPYELVGTVDALVSVSKKTRVDHDAMAEVLTKIFRMVKGSGPSKPDAVLDAVYKYTSAHSNGAASELSQQLEAEVAANVELRKQLEGETARTKFARESATGFKEEARIALQTAQHWKTQVETTQAHLRKAQDLEKRAGARQSKERAELESHRNHAATVHEKFLASQVTVAALQRQVAKLEVEIDTGHAAVSLEADVGKYKSLRKAVIAALRDGMKQAKSGGVATDNSARYNKAFNAGIRAGAAIVESEIYGCLLPEE